MHWVARAMSDLPAYLQRTPDTVHFTLPGDSWSELKEMTAR
jgi:hypothetical protein